MVLLALIAIGLLTLSAITVRSSSAELAQLEARANARMGLMLALGELQRDLGPDRAVSAQAAVLDANEDTLTIEGVEHPHWTVVWTTKWDANQETPWERNDREGGLRDLRFQSGYDREQQALNYLVSGNEGGANRDDTTTFRSAIDGDLNGDERVLLVDQSAGGTEEKRVYAPRVVKTDENGREVGAYSWWVGDMGVKADVSVVDYHRDDNPGPGARSHAGMERIFNAQDVGDEYIEGFGKIDEADASKSVTVKTLSQADGVEEANLPELFHDLATGTRSVLSNTRDGNLQRDLTAYLTSNGAINDLRDGASIVSRGIKDQDNLVGPANAVHASEMGMHWTQTLYREISPKYALLRNWALEAKGVAYSDQSREAKMPKTLPGTHPIVRGMRDNVNVYDNANFAPNDFLEYDTPNFAPVMVEGSIYYNIAAFPESNAPNSRYRIRMAIYPRVALWNPYNINLEVDCTVAELFVNGNKRIRLRSAGAGAAVQEIDIPIGRGSPNAGTGHPAHYRGTLLFTIPAVTLAPGETLVFTPNRAAQYDHANIFRNTLTPENPPSADLYYWEDMVDQLTSAPIRWLEWPEPGTGSGADNYLMALKDAGRRTRARCRPTDQFFNDLPLIIYANTSLQAGGADEPPVTWNLNRELAVYPLASSRDVLPKDVTPDVRTRDGFRLRWWREHASNLRGGGQLGNHPRHFETAAIANWNLRAGYFLRNPWDNVSSQPPYFYGVYTRDLFDPEVAWDAMMPRVGNRGFPFGPPSEGPDSIVLFEVPREETDIPSLGYFRHLKLSEFGWHPSYAIGNSLVDPRVGFEYSSPYLQSSRERATNGWNQYMFGWADGRGGIDYWALLHRQLLFEIPQTNLVVYDQSFEANFNLWDDYFLSTGTVAQKRDFVKDPEEAPLPNGRFRLFNTSDEVEDDIVDYHRAALHMSLDGGFNVHSVSKEAWKAVLSSTGDTGYGSVDAVPFPRMVNPPKGEWLKDRADDDEAMAGFRSLDRDQIDDLAEELVRQVKLRAPFFGLADFVNRRLWRDDELGRSGPIQSAIDRARVNLAFETEYPLDNDRELPQVSFDNMSDSTRLEQTQKPETVAWGLPGHLTQGDVLQVVGSSLRARSDTFIVRSYGESLDGTGKVQARAWCEAVVQRTPEPVEPDSHGLSPVEKGGDDVDFGRRFRVVSFRWLGPDEV